MFRWWIVAGALLLVTACGGKSSLEHRNDAGAAASDAGSQELDAGAGDAGQPVQDAGPMCPDGGTLCGTTCTDTQTDNQNCGDCNKPCADGLVCTKGTCSCPAPTGMCNGSCLDMRADDDNCGSCGHQCTGGTHCFESTCQASKIEHVVLIVQENHTFDAYFGRYCQAPAGSNPTCTSGPDCCEAAPDMDPAGTPPSVLDDVFNQSGDPNHSQACELEELDDGAMDLFTSGSDIGSSLCASACSRPQNFALADVSTVATYWQYADNNALADRYFQAIAGGTCSNNMYFAIAHEQFVDNDAIPKGLASGCTDPTHICLSGTPTGYDGRVTIADLLLAAGRTYSIYADGYADAVAAGPGECPSIPSDCPWNSFLHPINARSCLYDNADIPFQYYSQHTDDAHNKDYLALATDVAEGALPNFSFVKARAYRNEHPNVSDISRGEQFVTQTVETIMSSPYRDNTLILLTWDEGGGFYDHVPPPPSTDFDDSGAPVPHGTRVPLLAIGRFARQGTISHVVMDHASIVRFLEYNFIGKVGLLGYSDATVNNIGSLLDPTATGIPIPEMQ